MTKQSKITAAEPARCPGRSWEDILDESRLPVPDFLREESFVDLGNQPIAADRYTSPEFFRRELQAMWPNVWQFAARDEDMPEPGDCVVYENAGRSYLLVRQEDGSVKAFHNVCLHRGRKLRTESGWAKDLQCPFHGFTWENDGTLKDMPCAWDFNHLDRKDMKLPEASLAEWGGFIFVRESDEGPSLEEFMHPIVQHFERWKLEECTTAVWAAKVVHANWKVVSETFMEAWHSIITHPQLLAFLGDANTRYDIYGDHVNRALTPGGVLSPHLYETGKTEQWIAEQFLRHNGRVEAVEGFEVPPGQTARQALGDYFRKAFSEQSGRDLSHATDGELLDALVYNVFPNFSPWGGFMPNIVYRWRPWPDQDHTLMEVRILMRTPPGEKGRGVPMRMLGEDETWADVAEWGFLGEVFNQDMANIPHIQDGLRMSKNNLVQLGNYQEIRIRQFHQTLDKYLARFAAE